MVENNGTELTEHEAELYDRQIRLWGLESQKRIRGARILISGLNGLGAEIGKNIILSGVKSVTLCDHKNVTELDFCSQFLTPQAAVGTNRAQASLIRAQALNPMVELFVDQENVIEKGDEFFKNFDVVVILEAPTDALVRIDHVCRANRVQFFSGDLWGMHGYSFIDLQEHEFAEDVAKHKISSSELDKKKTETVISTVKRNISYPPLEKVINYDYSEPHFLRRITRIGPEYVIIKVLQKFRDSHGRDPSPLSRDDDIVALEKIRSEIGQGLIQDNAFVHVFGQISPAAAVVGGQLSQEIIKAISQKEAPIHNLFLFDPITCNGFVESIGT